MVKPRPSTAKFNSSDIIKDTEELSANSEIIKEDLHKYVVSGRWPISDELISPSMPDGGEHSVNLNIPVKSYQWDAIDRHVRALDVTKSKWIRYWIFYGMQQEQEYYLKNRKDK